MNPHPKKLDSQWPRVNVEISVAKRTVERSIASNAEQLKRAMIEQLETTRSGILGTETINVLASFLNVRQEYIFKIVMLTNA